MNPFLLFIIIVLIVFIVLGLLATAAFLVVWFAAIDSIGEKKYYCSNDKCVPGPCPYPCPGGEYVDDNCLNQCSK